ncbi:MAG TPA: hypothetical protein QF804_08830 [Rhodospirillales bacterium]|jgi:hypothetical protein|nr:hypothetical protein [Rhodospirillales bacterium]HJO69772.1 hypothetical protein [Rhodospirillales bacterium]
MAARRVLLLSALSAMVIAAALFAGPAFADAIDGTWCNGDGRNMQINGPRIVTPTGADILGQYSRHAFSYAVGQADAGATVSMVLVNESTIHLRRDGGASRTPPEAYEVWRRCEVITRSPPARGLPRPS